MDRDDLKKHEYLFSIKGNELLLVF